MYSIMRPLGKQLKGTAYSIHSLVCGLCLVFLLCSIQVNSAIPDTGHSSGAVSGERKQTHLLTSDNPFKM